MISLRTFSILNTWNNQCQGSITIANKTSKTINNWHLYIKTHNIKILLFYDFNSEKIEENLYKITPKYWNSVLNPGATLTSVFRCLCTGLVEMEQCFYEDISELVYISEISEKTESEQNSCASSIMEECDTVFAPYLSIYGKDDKINKCMDIIEKAGGNAVIMAFVFGDEKNKMSHDIYDLIDDFKEFNTSQGQLTISFGASGPHIEEYADEKETIKELSDLILYTGCKSFDFYIHGTYAAMYKMHEKRAKILAKLQQTYPDLKISYTLPADKEGISMLGLHCIQNALYNGVHIDIINLAVYNTTAYLGSGNYVCRIADIAIEQLKNIFTEKTYDEIYRLLGITVMIGFNKDGSKFMPSDARIVAKYARRNNIGRISIWSANRDQIGEGDIAKYSGVNTSDFEFLKTITKTLARKE